jgi:hypothetical protein
MKGLRRSKIAVTSKSRKLLKNWYALVDDFRTLWPAPAEHIVNAFPL